MGYCTVSEVDKVLAQALTSARPDTPGERFKVWEIGHVRDTNRIPDEVVNQYIDFGDSAIDGILSHQYVTPLNKVAWGEWALDADINEYNQQIELSDATNLVVGQTIVIRNNLTGDEETHTVASVINQFTVTVEQPILTPFEGEGIVVMRIQFPPPINQVSARYASSFIYDKYFAAQSAPDVSDYGNKMRDWSMGQLNDVLNGKVILENQRRVGDRFGGPNLDDLYQVRDRGLDTSNRNMSKL